MAKKSSLLLGAHMSVSGGLEQAIVRATSIGCTAVQIFTKSNRQWKATDLTQEQIDLFKKAKATSEIKEVITHACYLINLAASDDAIYEKSIDALTIELVRCQQLEIPYLVLHPGSAGAQPIEQAIKKVARGLDQALKRANGHTMLLLETMAGQGSSVGSTLEQLAAIRKSTTEHTKIGICADTCHLFAAGYQFNTPETYKTFWQKFDDIIGIKHLKCIHINDSKNECGSKVDRHEDIGKGRLGIQTFELIMNDPQLFDTSKILETPKGENELIDDLRNLDNLKQLLSRKNKELLI